MRRSAPPLVPLVALVATLGGCDNEIDLLSGEAPLPVVYGAFDPADSAHLISVTKTFAFAEDGGARAAALEPDSVYYAAEELSVVVANARTDRQVLAERIDLSATEVRREPGDFSPAPNVAYRFTSGELDLQPGDELEVALERPGQRLATARADVLPELSFLQARPPAARIAFSGEEPTYALSWRREEDAAGELAVYELGFVFAYLERDATGRSTARELYFPAATGLSAEVNAATISVAGFYDFLAANLPADPEVSRGVRYVQLVVTGGAEDFVAYAELLRANAGITATQQLPPFSNVDGGLGLFAGITQLRQDTFATLTPDSFDELREGERTRALNFE